MLRRVSIDLEVRTSLQLDTIMLSELLRLLECLQGTVTAVANGRQEFFPSHTNSTANPWQIRCNRLKPECGACRRFARKCSYGRLQGHDCNARLVKSFLTDIADHAHIKRSSGSKSIAALTERILHLEHLVEESSRLSLTHKEQTNCSNGRDSRMQSIMHDAQCGSRLQHETFALAQNQLRPSRKCLATDLARPNEQVRFSDVMVNEEDEHELRRDLVGIYFDRFHCKPYHILDERVARRRFDSGGLDPALHDAICAVAVRHSGSLYGSRTEAAKASEAFFLRSRAAVDLDEPSAATIEILLLLTLVGLQNGKGKRAFMTLSHAVAMMHTLGWQSAEQSFLPANNRNAGICHRILWSCYLMDRFLNAGSQRPCLIQDDNIAFYLTAPVIINQNPHGRLVPCFDQSIVSWSGKVTASDECSHIILVQIAQILGHALQYLNEGGVMGDYHYPWHPKSKHTDIRSKLENWITNSNKPERPSRSIFARPQSSILVLSKLVYHLIYCLINRPSIPLILDQEVSSTQYQDWRSEATKLSFVHANAIIETIEEGRAKRYVNWPPFVEYCVFVAGTIHVHGAHYNGCDKSSLFGRSVEFLSCAMQHLADLGLSWDIIQHHCEALRSICGHHARVVQSFTKGAPHYASAYQMKAFLDRYPGLDLDGAHVAF